MALVRGNGVFHHVNNSNENGDDEGQDVVKILHVNQITLK